MKILIVDDNADDRKILHQYLTHFGDEILQASDGAQGFASAMRERPDLIISDIMMPNVDGFGFLRELRRTPELLQTPFVFYTAVYTGTKDEELAYALGVDAFMAKPLEPEELLSQLKELLARLDKTKKRPLDILLEEDEAYLRKYSQVVAARLETKVRELEEANHQLSVQKTHYRNLFNSMRDVLIIADSSRKIIDINQPALRETFGYENEEVIGRRTDLFYGSKETFEQVGKEFFDLQNPQQIRLLDVEYRRKNGDLFIGELLAQKLVDEFGQAIGNIGVVRDVTEQRRTAEQLRHAQKMESIGTLAGGIAHDFNNILAAIIGYGGMVHRKMNADDPQRPKMEHLLEAADRAAHLTKELLLFSRKQALERKTVDINQIVSKSEKFLKRVIAADIEFILNIQPVPLPVLADAYQLEQVLMNIVTNARDAMPRGGTLTLSTEVIQFDDTFASTLGLRNPGDYALVTVSDTGAGMNQAIQKRLFEPFFTTKEIGKGTGLGLSIAYGIIQQHDGQICVESMPGKGTTLRIYLPLIASEAATQPDLEEIEPLIGGTETILLAEDNDMVRVLTRTILTESGYTVIEAGNGEEAVQKYLADKDSIDLLLFDIIMPRMNGKDACDEILKTRPEMKALFFSGYTPDSLGQKSSMKNGFQIISKPAAPVALLRKVREVLDGTAIPTET